MCTVVSLDQYAPSKLKLGIPLCRSNGRSLSEFLSSIDFYFPDPLPLLTPFKVNFVSKSTLVFILIRRTSSVII